MREIQSWTSNELTKYVIFSCCYRFLSRTLPFENHNFNTICNNKGKSWPADNPRECLDYIAVYKSYGDVRLPGPAGKGWEQYRPYVGEPAVTLHSEVVNTLASDHRPVFADIVLPTPVNKLLTTQPYLQLATPTSMNVMFQTNSVCHCWIEYGTDTNHYTYEKIISDIYAYIAHWSIVRTTTDKSERRSRHARRPQRIGHKDIQGHPLCSTSSRRSSLESTSACREMAGRSPSQGIRSQPYAGKYLRRHELRHEEDERRLPVS